MRNGSFDSTLLSVMENEKSFDTLTIFTEVFDYWYYLIFKTFNEKWKVQKLGIMAFNQFIDRIYTNDFLPNHHRYL